YEGLHRFDPQAERLKSDEERVVKKIDKKIMIWFCIMFIALQLDRQNIKQALTDNLLDDLGLNTNAIFYACFLFGGITSQMVSKNIGPHRWIPTQMVLWSIIASAQVSHVC
ncbi:hypothetical protein C7212DRAFT_157012, partial [Tuber magnatum]